MALHLTLVALGLFSAVGILEGVPLQGSSSQYPYEEIRPGKFAAVIVSYNSWQGAKAACETDFPGATLFNVETSGDSSWLGKRINFEKDRITGSSKFWIGLTSQRGNRQWLSGQGYTHYPEVVQIAGDDDSPKIYAWAVPDSGSRLKYEFNTHSDEAEAYICQHY